MSLDRVKGKLSGMGKDWKNKFNTDTSSDSDEKAPPKSLGDSDLSDLFENDKNSKDNNTGTKRKVTIKEPHPGLLNQTVPSIYPNLNPTTTQSSIANGHNQSRGNTGPYPNYLANPPPPYGTLRNSTAKPSQMSQESPLDPDIEEMLNTHGYCAFARDNKIVKPQESVEDMLDKFCISEARPLTQAEIDATNQRKKSSESYRDRPSRSPLRRSKQLHSSTVRSDDTSPPGANMSNRYINHTNQYYSDDEDSEHAENIGYLLQHHPDQSHVLPPNTASSYNNKYYDTRHRSQSPSQEYNNSHNHFQHQSPPRGRNFPPIRSYDTSDFRTTSPSHYRNPSPPITYRTVRNASPSHRRKYYSSRSPQRNHRPSHTNPSQHIPPPRYNVDMSHLHSHNPSTSTNTNNMQQPDRAWAIIERLVNNLNQQAPLTCAFYSALDTLVVYVFTDTKIGKSLLKY